MDGKVRPIRHANEFWDHYGVALHTPRPGDLVFTSYKGTFPTHIGIVCSDTEYIHAPGRDGTYVELAPIPFGPISVESADQAAIYNRNPIGFKALVQVCENPNYRYHQSPI